VNRRSPIIVGLAGLILMLLIVAVLVLPKARAVTNKRKEVTNAQMEQQTLELQLRQLQAEQQQAPQDQEKLQLLQAAVPETADLPGLIRLLVTAADEAGVTSMQFSPAQPAAGVDGKSSVISASIVVVGDFFAVDEYLRTLELLPRTAKILSVGVAPGGSGLSQLQASLQVQFFTTDTSAGPGSAPGPTGAGGTSVPPSPSPGGSPSPGPSGSPPFGSPSPSPTTSP
jgi:Tfp pilus assembly protein PilO